jgi:hypothetical protein
MAGGAAIATFSPMNARTLVFALPATSLLLTAGAGCALLSPRLDTRKVESNIQADMAKVGLNVTDVSCPANVPLRQTAEFRCTMKGPDGSPLVVTVTPDGRGGYHEEFNGTINEKKVTDDMEPKLSRDYGMAVDVQCEPRVIVAHEGSTFSCPAEVDRRPETMDCKVLSETGEIQCRIRYVLDEKTVADDLEPKFTQDLGVQVDMQCPDRWVVGHTDVTWSCPVMVGTAVRSVVCRVTDQVSGDVRCAIKA